MIAAYLLYNLYFGFALSQVNTNNTVLTSQTLTGQFNDQIMFCVAIGSIPILKLLIDLILKKNSTKHSLITYLTIISAGFILLIFRIYRINGAIEHFNNAIKNPIQNSMSIEELRFSLYLLYGFIIGAILSFMILKLSFRPKN